MKYSSKFGEYLAEQESSLEEFFGELMNQKGYCGGSPEGRIDEVVRSLESTERPCLTVNVLHWRNTSQGGDYWSSICSGDNTKVDIKVSRKDLSLLEDQGIKYEKVGE